MIRIAVVKLYIHSFSYAIRIYIHFCNMELTLIPQNNPQSTRTEWVLNWPGQVVIAGCQVSWTSEVTAAIEVNDIPGYFEKLLGQLGDLVTLVRGNLSSIARAVLSALIVVEVMCEVLGALSNRIFPVFTLYSLS